MHAIRTTNVDTSARRSLEGNRKGENTMTTNERKNTERKSAVIVGVLFIIATTFLFIGEAVYKPILSSPDYLEITYPNRYNGDHGCTAGANLRTGYTAHRNLRVSRTEEIQ